MKHSAKTIDTQLSDIKPGDLLIMKYMGRQYAAFVTAVSINAQDCENTWITFAYTPGGVDEDFDADRLFKKAATNQLWWVRKHMLQHIKC